VLNDQTDGPLMPTFSVQKTGNSLAWGIVHDAPASLVWEIGHTWPFASPQPDQYCTPNHPNTACDCYDAAHWAGMLPIQIKSVTFAGGSISKSWAVVSDFGGKAEVNQYCRSYGGPFCIYPWYSSNRAGTFHYGVDFPDTVKDYGQADQFAQTTPVRGAVRRRLDVLRDDHQTITDEREGTCFDQPSWPR